MTRVLVVNTGSSSVKIRLLDQDDRTIAADDLPDLERLGGEAELAVRLSALLDGEPPPGVVGHRVVHGGTEVTGPVLVDADVTGYLRSLTPLAPLHQPAALAGIAAAAAVLPGVPAVACADTAFHATMPAAAATEALPAEWRRRWGLRRYGFHGLSHSWAATRAGQLLGRSRYRLVSCHLGAGASLAAVVDGRSVATTMGFTPADGLVMATRAGSVDPGLLVWLLTEGGMPAGELADGLTHRSGLLGLAGTADMRVVQGKASAGDRDARLALDVYLHRLRTSIAAMAAAAGGLDALVFTGGVGEHSAPVRAAAADGLAFLGVAVDATANEAVDDAAEPDAEIGATGAAVRTFVVQAREDLEIAAQARATLAPRR